MARAKPTVPNLNGSTHVPAPVGGLNTVDPASDFPAKDAAILVNLIGGEGGLRPRPGYREHAIGLPGEARSLHAYSGAVAAAASDKLFACCEAGIYDVTAESLAPAQAIAFDTPGAAAGRATSLVYANAAGRYLLLTDEVNGYHVYTEGAGWSKIAMGGGGTQISGVNPGTFVQVVLYQGRLWFVERGSTRAWYLAAGAVYGAATKFDLGAQFKSGGSLAAIFVWTMDGGTGMNDKLVFVSTAGDVVIYEGPDPASAATFARAGGYQLGGMPGGRRLATQALSGDLLLLSPFGLIPLSTLVAGRTLLAPDTFASKKIRNLFTLLMADRGGLDGWDIFCHPGDGTVIVNVPKLGGETQQQIVLTMATGGWGIYRDLPIKCAITYNRTLYFGTEDGRVCIADAYADNVPMAGSDAVQQPINWGVLGGFRLLGGVNYKLVNLVTPIILTQGTEPVYQALVRFDYDLSDLGLQPGGAVGNSGVWGAADDDAAAAVWDQSVFGGSTESFMRVSGGTGLGRHVAVGLVGSSVDRMVLVGWDLTWEPGGLL